MKSKSLAVFSIQELKTTLSKTINADFQPTLAIVFSSPDFPFQEVGAIFKENQIELVGCTTAGEILNDSTLTDSLSILLMEMDTSFFKVFHQKYNNQKPDESSLELGQVAKETFENPGILVYSSGISIDGESVVRNIKAAIGSEISIYGGIAADNFRQIATHTFTNDHLMDYGLGAIIIDTDKIEMQGMAFSGWNEIGKRHTVTKADANVLFEIDGKPALDQFKKYFGNLDFQNTDGGEGLFTIPGQYPLKIEREDGTTFMRSTLVYGLQKQGFDFGRRSKRRRSV